MKGRTVVLVSHHVQLCAPGASYVVALDRGRVQFAGSRESFQASGVLEKLSHSGADSTTETNDQTDQPVVEQILGDNIPSPASSDAPMNASAPVEGMSTPVKAEQNKSPRKLIEEEKRAVGHVSRNVWLAYLRACGGPFYWVVFFTSLGLAALSPVLENGWLKYVAPPVCAI